jgi:hypothetical protein
VQALRVTAGGGLEAIGEEGKVLAMGDVILMPLRFFC